jgi:tetraacyldisaccharide 4'-kinase
MREPLAAGLARADAVVIVLPEGLDTADPELLALFAPLPVLTVRIRPVGPPPEGPLVGFAGVAKPWKVERALKAAGAEVVDFAPYPDHARLSPGDLAFLRDRAAALGASLVTTEKDFARLSPEARTGIATFPVTAVFEDEAALDALLDKAMRRWGRP